MNDAARWHFMRSQQLLPALINVAINGAIAWAMHRGTAALPLWRGDGYATDLLATGFLLPAITWLILRPLLRWQARKGRAPALAGVPRPRLGALIPQTLLRGALVCGLLGSGLALATLAALQLAGAPTFGGPAYALFKGLYAAALAWMLQPAMVFAVLAPAPAAR